MVSSLGIAGASLVLLGGGIFGCLGASTLFWSEKTQTENLGCMKDPQGEKFPERAAVQGKAFVKFQEIQKERTDLV